jgi:hypothetical protein
MDLRPDIPWVDAQTITPGLRRSQGQAVVKMDIRHKGKADLLFNGPNGLGCRHIRNRHPHNLASGFLKPPDLRHSGRNIVRVGIGHGLYGNRRTPPYGKTAQHNAARRPAALGNFHPFRVGCFHNEASFRKKCSDLWLFSAKTFLHHSDFW